MAFAISAGAVIRTVTTTIEEGFSLPKVEKFEELINERTKAILICNPNNPTGYLYTRREMNQIRDMVKKYDLYLFSDEVYRVVYLYRFTLYICLSFGRYRAERRADRFCVQALFRVWHPHRGAHNKES